MSETPVSQPDEAPGGVGAEPGDAPGGGGVSEPGDAPGGGGERPAYRQVRYVAPPEATEIVLVRHGETIPVRDGESFAMLEGHGDPELAPEGRKQAEQIAERLGSGPQRVDAIYVTTLRRTHETAAPLAARLGLTPVVEPGLREVNLGEWEGGVYRRHVIEQHPLAFEMFERERWDVIPGAESNEVLAERVRNSIETIAAAHPGGRVVVFAHGGTIGTVLAIASGSRPFAFVGSDNGAISVIVVADGKWFVRGFNDNLHLS